MKKQESTQQGDPQVIYRKNRSRLIQQNRQLYTEIFRIEGKVSEVLTKNISSQFKQKVQEQKLQQRKKQLTQKQTLEIRKLKKKILLMKNTDKPQQKQDMRQALDELAFLRKEKQRYALEKEALIKKRKLKDEWLDLNKPLQQQLKNMTALYRTAQRQNFDIRNKLLQIQRQINNLHKIKELAKTAVVKYSQDSQSQLRKIEQLTSEIRDQIKKIEKEWQPRVDSLDTEYFLLKEIKVQKQGQLTELEKTLNNAKNRVLGMKEQQKILEDRNRVSQIIVSPQKRQQINLIYEAEKERHQFFQQFKTRPRDQSVKHSSLKKQQIQQLGKKNLAKQSSKNLFQTQPVKLLQPKAKVEGQKQKQTLKMQNKNQIINQFAVETKQQNQQIQKIKPKKSLRSIAIGTTFYYNQDQQKN